MNVCLRLSAVVLVDVFLLFRFWHLGQLFRVGFPVFWEGLSGVILFCPSFQHCWKFIFVFVCVLNIFAGCRKNPLLKVLSWLRLRGNVSALDGMVTRLSVGGSCPMLRWTPTLCVFTVVRRSGAGIVRLRLRVGSVRIGPKNNGTCTWLRASMLIGRSPRLLILLRSRRGNVDRLRRLLDDRRSHRRSRLPLRDRSM